MSSDLQFRVLRHLELNSLLPQCELSNSLGVSLDGINYCLNALVQKGWIKILNFRNNKNNWVYAYLLMSQGIAEKTDLTGSFLRWRMPKYEGLKAKIESLKFEVKKADHEEIQ